MVFFKDLPYKLPEQVFFHFRNSSVEELELVARAYSSVSNWKKEPSFQEWLEFYQQNKVLSQIIASDERGKFLRAKVVDFERLVEEGDRTGLSAEELKPLRIKLKQYSSMLHKNDEFLLRLQEFLNKMTGDLLRREAPRKVEVTKRVVSPGDVASLLHAARKGSIEADFSDTVIVDSKESSNVDVEFEEVKK